MSEQLWYTWSDLGFGTAVGQRVRAASKGLVETESERVRNLVNLVSYHLRPETDAYLPPKEAPRSLVFTRAGSQREAVLISKAYVGLDGMRRPGAYFSHLLVELPPVPSPRPEGQIEFSAREAIELWRSSFWKNSERDLPAGRRDLPQVSREDLTSSIGPLSVNDVVQVANFFRYVLTAFLTLPTLGEQKRLYIAAPPDTVATLIWGLTHALPRTLNIMRNLTFSTFEHDIEDKAAPIIVGTCWLPHFVKNGHTSPRDLPPVYYQPNNPHGLAINCYLADKATLFPVHPPEITEFVEFAVKCFVQNTLNPLDEVHRKAEKENTTEVAQFLLIYASFQKTLDKKQVIEILTSLLEKVKKVIERAKLILEQLKIPSLEQIAQWESLSFQLEAEMLRRPNVRYSILLLVTDDPAWWRDQGLLLLSTLCQLANSYTDQALLTLHNDFINAIVGARLWKKDQGQEVSGHLLQLFEGYSSRDPTAVLSTFAEHIVAKVRTTQNDLVAALLPLAYDVAEMVPQAIGANDSIRTFSWADVLADSTPAAAEAEMWASLLQQLARAETSCNPAYQGWWRQYGKAKVSGLRSLATQLPESQLATLVEAFSAFAKRVATELSQALIRDDGPASGFWTEMLATAAPPEDEPEAWLLLLHGLAQRQARYALAYQQWWEEQGKAATPVLRRQAESAPQSEIATYLASFARSIANELLTQITDERLRPGSNEQRADIAFLLELLITATPATELSPWTFLLERLSQTAYLSGRNCDIYSWELRALLLPAWASVAGLRNNEIILRSWLDIRWSELAGFLSLRLPEEWYKVALIKLLSTLPDIRQPQDVVIVVIHYGPLFEDVLLQLIREPSTQRMAIDFFALLAQYHYPLRIQLLDGMMIASQYQLDIAEVLLAALQPVTRREVDELLKLRCQELIASYPLPPTLVGFLRTYLVHFDVDYLQEGPTRDLLQRLQQRQARPELRLSDELQAYVEFWSAMAAFIGRPTVGIHWLRSLSQTIHSSRVLLAPETKEKLAGVLVPPLVDCVSDERELTRVMDNLGEVLLGAGQEAIEPGLLLLEQMASKAGERYGRERPPIRLVAYIKVVLGEARSLSAPEKEAFIDRCFHVLLQGFDTKIRNQLFKDNPAFWPEEIFAEWKEYLRRNGTMAVEGALTRFKEALGYKEMFAIVATYDPIIDERITKDEHMMLGLARKFVEAYKSNDDAAIVTAYHAIHGSQYRPILGYTPDQLERIKLAQSHQPARRQPSASPFIGNMPAPSRAPALSHAESPSVAATDAPVFVASVQGEGITLEWFEKVYSLKEPYIAYRISTLKGKLQQLEQQKPRQRERERWRKREIDILEKLQSEPERLRQAALDDLVDDVLIREPMEEEAKKQLNTHLFDTEGSLPAILQDFKTHHTIRYEVLLRDHKLTEEQVKEVLRIFRRRELFATYLDRQGQTILPKWLKKQKQSKSTSIMIDYQRADIRVEEGLLDKFKGLLG
jgi:hypothetical protein